MMLCPGGALLAVLSLLTFSTVEVAHAATPRMYTGSLIIQAFGNATAAPTSLPNPITVAVGIPLAGNCNTAPLHAKETLTFPTYGTNSGTLMFTIPRYGGAVPDVDTNSDNVPDIVSGCGDATLLAGDPLTGGGPAFTTGSATSARTAMNPRGFVIFSNQLIGGATGASRAVTGSRLWEVHDGDLRNDGASFLKNGGDGSFSVAHQGIQGTRKAVQTAGANQFGGVMRLLGTYSVKTGYAYNGSLTTALDDTWLLQYMGHGGQVLDGSGMVTSGYYASETNFGYTIFSASPISRTVKVEAFKWTTGAVRVTALQGAFQTVLERNGYDARTPMGAGVIQMVSPMLTHWVGFGETSTASIGVMKLTFAPEPSGWLTLAAGISLLMGLNRLHRGKE